MLRNNNFHNNGVAICVFSNYFLKFFFSGKYSLWSFRPLVVPWCFL